MFSQKRLLETLCLMSGSLINIIDGGAELGYRFRQAPIREIL